MGESGNMSKAKEEGAQADSEKSMNDPAKNVGRDPEVGLSRETRDLSKDGEATPAHNESQTCDLGGESGEGSDDLLAPEGHFKKAIQECFQTWKRKKSTEKKMQDGGQQGRDMPQS